MYAAVGAPHHRFGVCSVAGNRFTAVFFARCSGCFAIIGGVFIAVVYGQQPHGYQRHNNNNNPEKQFSHVSPVEE